LTDRETKVDAKVARRNQQSSIRLQQRQDKTDRAFAFYAPTQANFDRKRILLDFEKLK